MDIALYTTHLSCSWNSPSGHHYNNMEFLTLAFDALRCKHCMCAIVHWNVHSWRCSCCVALTALHIWCIFKDACVLPPFSQRVVAMPECTSLHVWASSHCMLSVACIFCACCASLNFFKKGKNAIFQRGARGRKNEANISPSKWVEGDFFSNSLHMHIVLIHRQ